jgi:hypothetical protein
MGQSTMTMSLLAVVRNGKTAVATVPQTAARTTDSS